MSNDDSFILLWGNEGDIFIEALTNSLDKRDIPYIVFNDPETMIEEVAIESISTSFKVAFGAEYIPQNDLITFLQYFISKKNFTLYPIIFEKKMDLSKLEQLFPFLKRPQTIEQWLGPYEYREIFDDLVSALKGLTINAIADDSSQIEIASAYPSFTERMQQAKKRSGKTHKSSNNSLETSSQKAQNEEQLIKGRSQHQKIEGEFEGKFRVQAHEDDDPTLVKGHQDDQNEKGSFETNLGSEVHQGANEAQFIKGNSKHQKEKGEFQGKFRVQAHEDEASTLVKAHQDNQSEEGSFETNLGSEVHQDTNEVQFIKGNSKHQKGKGEFEGKFRVQAHEDETSTLVKAHQDNQSEEGSTLIKGNQSNQDEKEPLKERFSIKPPKSNNDATIIKSSSKEVDQNKKRSSESKPSIKAHDENNQSTVEKNSFEQQEKDTPSFPGTEELSTNIKKEVNLKEKLKQEVDKRNSKGQTSLMLACSFGDIEKINLLLSAGANPKLISMDGKTTLHYACRSNCVEAASLLLSKGVKNNTRDLKGHTPVYEAVRYKSAEILDFLIKKGVTLRSNFEGKPLLHWAAHQNSLTIFKILLVGGANIDAKDNNGENVIDYCTRKKRLPLIKIIKAYKLMKKKAA